MSESSDGRRIFRGARNPGAGWTPMAAEDFAAELARSELHSHYAVKELLDYGGMGAVYLAEDRRSPQPLRVAIKMLRPEALADKTFIRRFETEIKSLRAMDHPNVVRILDAGETCEGYRFFVMELLSGQTLAEILERPSRMPVQRVERIMADICRGVEHAHGKKFVHRDLKASNVLIVEDEGWGERAVVLDFGVARDLTAVSSGSSGTGTGEVPGTLGHIAPELKAGKKPTVVSDVYSLGVVFCHMLTGKIPDGNPHLARAFGFDYRLDAVAGIALSQEPDARYQSAADLEKAIRDAIGQASAGERPVNPAPPPPHRREPDVSATHAKAPVKTPGSAATATAEAPQPQELGDPSPARLQQHLRFLADWVSSEEPKKPASTPISDNERWKVIDQWPAFPEIPPVAEVERKLALRRGAKVAGVAVGIGLALIASASVAFRAAEHWWQIPLIFLGAGAVGSFFLGGWGGMGAGWLFMRISANGSTNPSIWDWHWDTGPFFVGLIDEDWERRYPHQSKILDPHQIFWHPAQPHLFVSRDHERITSWRWSIKERYAQISDNQTLFSAGSIQKAHFSERFFLIQSESWRPDNGGTDHWILFNEQGARKTKITGCSEYLKLFGDLRSNPLRPTRDYSAETLAFPSEGIISLCSISKLPETLHFPTYDLSKLQEFAKATINLRVLQVAENESVGTFAWHPSGHYLAIEISGRVDLIHWDHAEVIRQPESARSAKCEAAGWSSDGALLALDRTVSRVWDVRTDTIRDAAEHERWDLRDEGGLDNKLQSCDGLRRFDRWSESDMRVGSEFNLQLHREALTDVAWSPDDPDVFASIGGTGCPRDIRIWQRVK